MHILGEIRLLQDYKDERCQTKIRNTKYGKPFPYTLYCISIRRNKIGEASFILRELCRFSNRKNGPK